MMKASLMRTSAGDGSICRSLVALFNERHLGPATSVASDIMLARYQDMGSVGAREDIGV
jgi:hypothetical protein